jgi:hypothetical protein
MYYIQATSNNAMLTIKGWATISQAETKQQAEEDANKFRDAIEYKKGNTKIRVISQRNWRKEIWGA